MNSYSFLFIGHQATGLGHHLEGPGVAGEFLGQCARALGVFGEGLAAVFSDEAANLADEFLGRVIEFAGGFFVIRQGGEGEGKRSDQRKLHEGAYQFFHVYLLGWNETTAH